MNHRQEIIKETAETLSRYGYKVYISKDGTYGFYTNGTRVVSFGVEFSYLNFSGNYKSSDNGTGWRIASERGIPTLEEASSYIAANSPFSHSGYTTPEQHLATYGRSSGYEAVYC